MSPQDAELVLLAMGYCERDAYDLLADAGYDPHPEAEPKWISNSELERLVDAWLDEHMKGTN